MEYQRVYRRRTLCLLLFMLKGEIMKTGEGCQESFNTGLEEANAWWEKHTAGCVKCSIGYRGRFQRRYRPASKKPEPAKSTVLARPTDNRYFKLHDGNILDTENKMILSGEVLKELLND